MSGGEGAERLDLDAAPAAAVHGRVPDLVTLCCTVARRNPDDDEMIVCPECGAIWLVEWIPDGFRARLVHTPDLSHVRGVIPVGFPPATARCPRCPCPDPLPRGKEACASCEGEIEERSGERHLAWKLAGGGTPADPAPACLKHGMAEPCPWLSCTLFQRGIRHCPRCSTVGPEEATTCGRCGRKTEPGSPTWKLAGGGTPADPVPGTTHCPSCSIEGPSGALACGRCGGGTAPGPAAVDPDDDIPF